VGGNFGTRASNGEWWRWPPAVFVHSGMLPLVVNIGMLIYVRAVAQRTTMTTRNPDGTQTNRPNLRKRAIIRSICAVRRLLA